MDAELEPHVGVKRAAIRKLEHELGIVTSRFQPHDFKYATTVLYRVRFWFSLLLIGVRLPADVLTTTFFVCCCCCWLQAASDPNWTEYEVDHVLLVRGDVALDVNPNEVDQVRFVAQHELAALLADDSMQLSPWFRLIATRLLPDWWANLDAMLVRDNPDTSIHNYCGGANE